MSSGKGGPGIPRWSEVPKASGALAFGLCLAFAAWGSLRWQERQAAAAAFEGRAAEMESHLRQSLEAQADTLRACQGLFESGGPVKAAEWEAFVARIWSADRNPGLTALAFAPVLAKTTGPAGDASEFWRAQAQSPSQDCSAPLRYTTPMTLEEWDPALRDLLAEPHARAAALEALARNRVAAATFSSMALQGRRPRLGFWLMAGVRADRRPKPGGADMEGPALVAAVCDLETILAHAQPDDGSFLLELADTSGARVSVPVPGTTVDAGALRQDRAISFGGRYWTLSVIGTRRFHPGRGWLPWTALVVGCLASLGLAAAVFLLAQGRRRAESLVEELGMSEARYRDLVQGLGDLVYRVDLEGRFTFINAAAEKLLGYTPEELEGRKVRDFLPPGSRREARQALPRIQAGEVVQDLPIGFACKDGRTRWLAASATALHGPEGAVIGTQGTMRDVTEARQAQRALEESEEKFRAFAETLSCVILLFDDRIRYVNPFATRMLGWTPEELLGQPFWKI
ncbi:MAG TPA: PAS domain S-box protein, partial [Holophagaceae bacterium]|nr:PAS domain S-box protein [Holophagaceae bacterium]